MEAVSRKTITVDVNGEQYEREGDPYFGTAQLWDDGIIDPAETRTYLGLGLSVAYNARIEEPRFGVFRM